MAERERRIAAGLTLIVLGGILYLLERSVGIDAAAVLLIIGGAFLAYYFYKREYGLLIPACIMLGLGTGTVVSQTQYDYGQPSLWGLGLGFISIFIIAWITQRESHWWPLIPGGILVLLGLPRTQGIIEFLFDNWPLILVAVGVLILIGAFRTRPRPE
jgi:hypothetical protein